MWQYGYRKLHEMGVRAAFAGWRLSFLKDSVGYAAFFATFEYVKAQGYYEFVTWYYGNPSSSNAISIRRTKPDKKQQTTKTLKPHYAIEPIFLLLAGLSASLTQQMIQHPITVIQQVYYQTCSSRYTRPSSSAAAKPNLKIPLRTKSGGGGEYARTFKRSVMYARRFGGWRRWLYRGFWAISVKQMPSTSAGLVVFELVRRRYSSESEAVKIHKDDYDIILT